MTDSAFPPQDMRTRPDGAPCRDLYIYYVDGCPKPGFSGMGRDFIGNWEEAGASFLFFSRPAREAVDQLLAKDSGLRLLDQFHMTYDQWQGGGLTAFRVGPLVIAPPWEKPGPVVSPQDLLIELDPGVVFGTGTHATTRDCLTALTLACKDRSCQSALDLGTGTGLLALAAARLGCRQVLAVDLNPLAAQTARDNIRRNRMQNRILAVQGRAQTFIDTAADLVIANIHFEVMRELIKAPGFVKKRRFILSGLLRSEVRDILYQLRGMPVEILKKWEQDGTWFTLYGRVDPTAPGSGMAG